MRSALEMESDGWSSGSDWAPQLGPRESVACFLPCSSRPVVDVVTLISFSPAEIPVHEVECSHSASSQKKEGVNITVCFQVKSLTPHFQGQCWLPAARSSCPL